MSGRTALVGVAVAASFIVLAWVSGTLSPLAREPVLDGLGPLAPYRWVSPPDGVANEGKPLAATFELAVDDEGSEPDVLFTPDDQVTLVMDRGAIDQTPGRRSVTIEVTPLDAATLSPLPDDLTAFGNAVLIDADDVERFDGQVDVILLYAETRTLHATRHELLWSLDGVGWERLDTTDTRATQQAHATLEAPGYVVVGAVRVPHPFASTTPAPEGTDGSDTPIVVVVLGAATLIAVGIAARFRRRRSSGSPSRRESRVSSDAR